MRHYAMTSTASERQRRAHFRLRYPETARPLMQCNERSYAVAEISEGGLRMSLADAAELLDGEETVTGQVELPEGPVEIVGRPLRLDNDELVLALERGPSLHIMIEEQKRLIRSYPGLFGKGD